MKARQHAVWIICNRKGATAIIVAIVLAVLLGFTALAVDVGYLMVTRNELQNVADAAALAGARTLGRLYECDGDIHSCTHAMSYENQQTYTANVGLIRQSVTEVAGHNRAGGKSGIDINHGDIIIGRWSAAQKEINPVTLVSADAVRVTARRDSTANSPITTFFAGIFGIHTMEVTATATAALTGLSVAAPGGLPMPFAINKAWVAKPENCGNRLRFRPASLEACAAWNAYDEGSGYSSGGNAVPASKMRQLLNDLAAGTYASPETIAGETQYVIDNGVMANAFEDLLDLFNVMRVLNDGILDMDDDPATWTASIPVYDDEGMSNCNPSGTYTIIGFATITVTDVLLSPDKEVWGHVVCDLFEPGRGGGSDFGTKGTIPGLVE